MARQPVWMLAAMMALGATPALAKTPIATPPAPAPKTSSVTMPAASPAHLFQDAFTGAIALQGAIAMGDWAGAQLQVANLRMNLYQLRQASLPGVARTGVDQLNTTINSVARAVDAQNGAQAADAAYNLVKGFSVTLDQLATAGGGGGGQPGASKPLGNASAMEHIHEGYMEAAKAQYCVAQRDMSNARLYLLSSRMHLDQAVQAGADARLSDTIHTLQGQVDKAVATLATPKEATTRTRGLVLAYAETFRTAAAPMGGGGGGGNAAPTRPQPYRGDVVPQMSDQQPGGQSAGQNAGDQGTQAPTMDNTERDRPNQSGRQ